MSIALRGDPQIGSASGGGHVTLTFDPLDPPQEGDVVYVFGGGSAAPYNPRPGTPGYTELGINSRPDPGPHCGVWRKVMGSTPDTEVVGEGSGGGQQATVYAARVYSGVDGTTPEDAATVLASGLGSDPDLAAITTLTNGAVVVVSNMYVENFNFVDYPAGYGNGQRLYQAETHASDLAVAERTIAAAGLEDPGIWSWAADVGDAWDAFTVAIRPAGDGSTLLHHSSFAVATDTPLPSYTPDTGAGWTLEVQNSTSDTVSALAATGHATPSATDTNGGITFSAQPNPSVADYYIEAKVGLAHTGGNDRAFALLLRYQDGNNWYAARILPGSQAPDKKIQKCVAGVVTDLATVDHGDSAVGDVWKFDVSGTALKLYKNDVEVLTADDGDITAPGKACLAWGWPGSSVNGGGIPHQWEIDEFTVREFAAGGGAEILGVPFSGVVGDDYAPTIDEGTAPVAIAIPFSDEAGADHSPTLIVTQVALAVPFSDEQGVEFAPQVVITAQPVAVPFSNDAGAEHAPAIAIGTGALAVPFSADEGDDYAPIIAIATQQVAVPFSPAAGAEHSPSIEIGIPAETLAVPFDDEAGDAWAPAVQEGVPAGVLAIPFNDEAGENPTPTIVTAEAVAVPFAEEAGSNFPPALVISAIAIEVPLAEAAGSDFSPSAQPGTVVVLIPFSDSAGAAFAPFIADSGFVPPPAFVQIERTLRFTTEVRRPLYLRTEITRPLRF